MQFLPLPSLNTKSPSTQSLKISTTASWIFEFQFLTSQNLMSPDVDKPAETCVLLFVHPYIFHWFKVDTSWYVPKRMFKETKYNFF